MGEAEHEDVLHRVLAQVVIEPVDVVFAVVLVHEGVERFRAREILAERLFEDEPRPAGRAVQTGFGEALDRRRKGRKRQSEVERAIARKIELALERFDALPKSFVFRLPALAERLEEERFLRPGLGFGLVDAVFGERAGGGLSEFIVGELRAGRAEDRMPLVRLGILIHVVERGEELAIGEIAGGAEDHEEVSRCFSTLTD